MSATLQWIATAVAFGLLAFNISQHGHSGMKGTPVPLLTVTMISIVAAVVSVFMRLGWNTIAGRIACPFVAGIAGVFASGEPRYGPYGGIVGLLVGTIITFIPLDHDRRSPHRHT